MLPKVEIVLDFCCIEADLTIVCTTNFVELGFEK